MVGKPEWKKVLGRPKRRCEHNTEVVPKEMVGEIVNWIKLTQNGSQWRVLVNTAMKFRFL